MEQSDAILAAVMRSSLDGIVVIDEAGRAVEFNPAAEAMFGHARADVLGRLIGDVIVPPAARGAHAEGFRRYLNGGEPHVLGRRVEVEAMRADGTLLPVELAITETRTERGRLFTACLRDLSERRAAEAALRESEARLTSFLEHAPVAMYLKDLDGRYAVANPYLLDVMGLPKERVVGRHFSEVLGPGAVEEVEASDQRLLETGAPQVGEVVFPTRTGPRPTLTVRFPLRDASGTVTHLGGVIIDISERKAAEARLQESEARLRASEARLQGFLEHAPAVMYLKDLEGRYVLANSQMLRAVGRTADEVIGTHYARIVNPDTVPEIERADRELVETGQPKIDEGVLKGRKGAAHVLSVRFPVRDLEGRVTHLGGVIFDITAQKAAEGELRESERRFRALSDLHPVPVLFLRAADGRVLLANPAFRAMMRIPDDWAGPPRARAWFVDEAERARVLDLLGRTDQAEAHMRRFDGTDFWAAISARRVELDGETVVVASFADLTDRKRAEAELERSREALFQSEKLNALGSLLAGVSHELNNPLAVAVGQAIILEEDAVGTDFADAAGRIRRAAERCSRIVQTFLAMARQKKPERRAVDANALVDGALEIAGYGLRTAGVRVERAFAADLPPVWADPDQAHQVVINLLVNAQQAMQEQPGERRLTVRTALGATPGSVLIEVADTGPGIPPDIARRVFDPFYTTKPQGVGTGVGLSFSRGIAEAHGGRLRLRPDGPGATFALELPTADPAAAPAAATAIVAAAASKGRVLIVDDEEELAETLALFVRREGYAADIATGGEEAKRLIAANGYEAVLSDLRMPDLDGPGLYAWLLEMGSPLSERVGFVTGDTLGPNAIRFLDDSGRPFVEKPFGREQVRGLLSLLTSAQPREPAAGYGLQSGTRPNDGGRSESDGHIASVAGPEPARDS